MLMDNYWLFGSCRGLDLKVSMTEKQLSQKVYVELTSSSTLTTALTGKANERCFREKQSSFGKIKHPDHPSLLQFLVLNLLALTLIYIAHWPLQILHWNLRHRLVCSIWTTTKCASSFFLSVFTTFTPISYSEIVVAFSQMLKKMCHLIHKWTSS